LVDKGFKLRVQVAIRATERRMQKEKGTRKEAHGVAVAAVLWSVSVDGNNIQ